MDAPTTEHEMADEGRGLITDREKEILSGEADVRYNYRKKVESTVRNRIKKRLGDDMDFFDEHFEDAHELVIDIVCNDKRFDEDGDRDE